MTGTMSLYGMIQIHPTILDDIAVPYGVNKDTLCDNIVLECAELEVLYSDAPFLQKAIEVWSTKQLATWTRLFNAEKAQYNPIENYDRQESWTDNANGLKSVKSQNSGSGSTQSSSTDLSLVAGYNSEQMTRSGETDSSGISTQNTSATGSGTEENTNNATHTGRVHGNIGVTTSQQMLEQELEVAPKLNIYNIIITDFKRRFCLLVY